ncbi:MAG: peroxiredoxin [Flavobacteriales bacterium]|nr:peroxiredoxin [Flavobacteriales bacterium]
MSQNRLNQINGIPRIGDQAPDFNSPTTHGDLQFSEYNKDSWVIFFAHPADFTPVCTTELVEFAKNKSYFDQKNTKLIGVSIDSVHAHLAWVQNVKQNSGVLLDFPIIADLDQSVAQKYGLLHPGESATAAVRAVFIIDPKQTIRAIIYYPLNVGRNIDEVKRVLTALQTADEFKVALPVNWVEGEKVVVPPPKTLAEVGVHDNKDYERTDFYLLKKDLN